MSTDSDGFFSTTTTTSARFALIADKIIRLDEIQSAVSSIDETEDSPVSMVCYRNKEMDKVDISREDLFELLGTKIAV